MLIAIHSFFIGWTDAQSFRHRDEEDQDRPKTSSQTPFLADSLALFLSWHALQSAAPYLGGFGDNCWDCTRKDRFAWPRPWIRALIMASHWFNLLVLTRTGICGRSRRMATSHGLETGF
jgi:hypothetical protein